MDVSARSIRSTRRFLTGLIPNGSIHVACMRTMAAPGQADRMRSANAALGVRGVPPPPTPPRRVPACGDSPSGQGWRYTPGPRKSSWPLAAAKPCSLRGLGRWDARARCTSSFYRLALRATFEIKAFHGVAMG
jgi:hypothetical protein